MVWSKSATAKNHRAAIAAPLARRQASEILYACNAFTIILSLATDSIVTFFDRSDCEGYTSTVVSGPETVIGQQ